MADFFLGVSLKGFATVICGWGAIRSEITRRPLGFRVFAFPLLIKEEKNEYFYWFWHRPRDPL